MNPFPPTQRTDISLFLCLVTVHNLSEYLSFGNGQELKSYHLTRQKDKIVLNRGARERILNRQPSFQQLQWGRLRGRNILHRTLSWHSDPRAIWRIKQQGNEDQLPAVRIQRDLLEKITSRRDPKHWQLIPSPISSLKPYKTDLIQRSMFCHCVPDFTLLSDGFDIISLSINHKAF